MIGQASLFDRPQEPVMEQAGQWAGGILGGTLAVSLCVIAIALLGMMLMSGRISFRHGVPVVFGCFLLLGASAIASGFSIFGNEVRARIGEAQVIEIAPVDEQQPSLPPAQYDPYAGASLRRD